ncbi:MAG: hypothetical protein QM775_09905 [Pirellulales bacterium]
MATAVGALAVLAVLVLGVQGYRGAVSLRQTQLNAARDELNKKQLSVIQAAAANLKLSDWEQQSLPRNREVARSLYQNWLVAELNKARLSQVTVDAGRGTQLRDVFTKQPFTVRARGRLESVSRFLTAFYKADHLQQIRDLALQPLADGSELQVTMTIEALVLNDAARLNALHDGVNPTWNQQSSDAAVKTIVERNLFAAYVPPPPPPPPPRESSPPPPPPPAFDPAKFTFLTSIISVDDQPQAWLNVRPTNQLLRLFEGDSISVGRFEGKLVRIGDREIEIEAAGKRRVVAIGKSLEQGVELPL